MPGVSKHGLVMVVGAVLSLSGAACSKPQSGLFAATWCRADAGVGVGVQVLDDMEDDDGKACAGQGAWRVVHDGSGQTTPKTGAITMTAELTDSDLAFRAGHRALHLSGTDFGDGETAALRIDLVDGDLTPYNEVQFWARTDAVDALDFRVAVATETTADSGVYWGIPVTVTQKWGDGEGKAFSFPLLGDGDKMVPDDQKDLAHALGLEFQVRASAATPSFGYWIDDVVFIRRP